MPRLWFAAFALGLSIAQAGLPPPNEWKIPPLDGEVEGEFNALLLGGAPRVKWKLNVRTEKPRERTIEYSLDGHGVRARGEARVDPVGEGAWKIAEAEVNLGEWFGWLAPQFAAEAARWSVGGTLDVSGAGTWREGKLGGSAKVAMRAGRFDDTTRKVSFEGLDFSVDIQDLASPRTAPAQVVTWKSGKYDVVTLGAGRIEFTIDGDKVNIASAVIAVFGGELAVRDVSFSTQRPEFSASAQMTGVDVGQLLFLFPKVLSHARGRLDGYMDLARDRRGIAVGSGYLGLREGETAELRLTPTPGVISSSLPPAVKKLYPGLLEMETGGIPMQADLLQLRFMPEGDEQGRTAWVHVVGRPVDPSFKGPVDLNINIRGPLDSVINRSADSALRLMGGR